MKNFFFRFYLLAFVFTSSINATQSSAGVDVSQTVSTYFEGNASMCVSGKAIFVHHVWEKAINEAEWLKGAHFKDDAARQAFIERFASFGGLNLKLKADRNSYELISVLFDKGDKVRKDVLKISEQEANQCKSVADVSGLFKKRPPDAYSYDGNKSIGLIHDFSRRDGIGVMGTVDQDKIAVPTFWNFGHCDPKAGATLLSLIKKGDLSLSGFEKDGLIYATLKFRSPFGEYDLIIDPHKDNVLVKEEMKVGSAFVTRTVCDSYVQTQSGQWFPQIYRIEKETQVGNKMILTFVEEYRAINESVDFNFPIDATSFSVWMPSGTPILDRRKAPYVESIIPAGKHEFVDSLRSSGSSEGVSH